MCSFPVLACALKVRQFFVSAAEGPGFVHVQVVCTGRNVCTCGPDFFKEVHVVWLQPGHGVRGLLETSCGAFGETGAQESPAALVDLRAVVDASLFC